VPATSIQVSCEAVWILETAPQYKSLVEQVWLWDEWPDKWGPDTGIDIVVKTKSEELWAVQSKAYDETYSIKKQDIDSFFSASSRSEFSYRLLMATTDKVANNARATINGTDPPCDELLRSDLDW
jgi:predicted helicase